MTTDSTTCMQCRADLTIPESVTRTYRNKDKGDDCTALGHYSLQGDFESDSFDGFDGDRYDCLDDSDSCSGCGGPL